MNPTAIDGHLKFVLSEWIVIIAAACVFERLGKN
jgi:hypothetical protein